MNIRIALLLGCLALGTGLTGCMSSASAEEIDDSIPDLPDYDGPRARLALTQFQWGAASGQNANLTVSLQESLETSLVESGRFSMLNRQVLADMERERDIRSSGSSGASDENLTTLKGADVLVHATVLEFDENSGGSSANASGGGWLSRGWSRVAGGMSKEKGKVAIKVKLIDASTSEIIGQRTVMGEASGTSWNANASSWSRWGGLGSLGGGLSQYEDKPMGQAIRLAIARAVEGIVKLVPDKYYAHE